MPLDHRPTAAALTHISQLSTQHEVQLPGSSPQSPGPYFQMAICLGMSKHDQEGWAFRAKEMEATSCCVTILRERCPDKNECCRECRTGWRMALMVKSDHFLPKSSSMCLLCTGEPSIPGHKERTALAEDLRSSSITILFPTQSHSFFLLLMLAWCFLTVFPQLVKLLLA